ncbi:hypothetical protein Cgig2_016042 [Carnegiea gigantea]|uniref:Uncharacterized protein n=1 Tax=Carnegiea gigantea TaxID=171969 RepID=A0A9Q1KP31_9CARY|nr:hypothetical protein Cgig2_016042 [Carnegiea gigantea]
MGEALQSFEEAADVVVVEETQERANEERIVSKEGGSSSMVRWERFLPRMGLRVLLVEADDSTRQIIGALLRKCSYKVASVPDGLKAWEVLKARPHNIDLILTEVELPLISGYALLTLIMEQEICKNIPVIMMSTHDSVNMVYKCMLKGAVDFLVKPIRINELKNLWQHVWRRQCVCLLSILSPVFKSMFTSYTLNSICFSIVNLAFFDHSVRCFFQLNRGLGPPDESVAQRKLEATAENDATSDHSSSSKACAARQDQSIKKGSDAQSSCGQPHVEAKNADMAAQEEHHSQPKLGKSPVSNSRLQENSSCADSGQNLSTHKSTAVAGSEDNTVCNNNDALDQDERLEQQNNGEGDNVTEVMDTRDIPANSSGEPIDLLVALNGHSRHNSCSNDKTNKFDVPELDLSLRRLFPGVENKAACERQLLNHSNASAFTREVDNEYQSVSQRLFPIPLPVRGIRVDVRAPPAGHGPVIAPVVCTPSPSPSPNSANQLMNSFHQFSVEVINGRHHFHNLPLDQIPRISSNQPMTNKDQRLEALENRPHFSPAADQHATSTVCNSTATHQDAVGLGGSDNGNDQIQATCDLNLQRSIQREAALTKFRLKRKERCYEKKVRYESRKKLAEQRPRVKGQFVRQVPPDPPPSKSDNSGGTSAAK